MAMPAKTPESAFWKLFIKLKGKTPQRQVALKMGISPQAIQGWKNGAIPDTSTVRRLAKALHAPADLLLASLDDGGEAYPARISAAIGVIGGLEVLAAALDVEPNDVRSWIDGSSEPPETQRRRIGAILRAVEEKTFHDVGRSTRGGSSVESDALAKVLSELGLKDPVERLHFAGLIRAWDLDEAGAKRLVEARRASAAAKPKR